MESSSTFDPYNSTITRWILTKNVYLKKGNDMEIISSKQQEEFKDTTFVVNILKLQTNPKVLIQEFVWSFEILIPNVLYIIHSFYLDYIIPMVIAFKRHLFCQNPIYNCGVIGVESQTISHTFAVIFAATGPHPRCRPRRKPCNGLLISFFAFDRYFLF